MRNKFNELYGSGYTQKINNQYELLMTDSTSGFLIDKPSDVTIPIINPQITKDIVYGEYKPKYNGNKYFLININNNSILEFTTKDEFYKTLNLKE